MKVLFDINVVLDVLLNKAEFVKLSASLVSLVETKKLEGFLCATTLTTIDYLVTKNKNRKTARDSLHKLLKFFHIWDVNKQVLNLSVESSFKDFEGAVQYYSGKCSGVDCILTRNSKDYKNTKLPIYTPTELWNILENLKTEK